MTCVIPVWGPYRDSLAAAVSSVRAATSADVRIVVVDNASDPPISIADTGDPDVEALGVEALGVEALGVEVLRVERRVSLGAARNIGLGAVTSRYVVFLDADDELLPDALDVLGDALTRARAVAAHGRLVRADDSAYGWPTRWMERLHTWPGVFARTETVRACWPVNGSLLVTDVVKDAGGYAEHPDAAEDWPLGVSLAWRGPIVAVPAPTMRYTPHPTGRWTTSHSRPARLAHARQVRARVASDPAIGLRAGRAWVRLVQHLTARWVT